MTATWNWANAVIYWYKAWLNKATINPLSIRVKNDNIDGRSMTRNATNETPHVMHRIRICRIKRAKDASVLTLEPMTSIRPNVFFADELDLSLLLALLESDSRFTLDKQETDDRAVSMGKRVLWFPYPGRSVTESRCTLRYHHRLERSAILEGGFWATSLLHKSLLLEPMRHR